MNWEAIGAIGEIIGAAAVVGSLVYLAVQIQSQNRESRISSMHDLSVGYRDSLAVMGQKDTADLYAKAYDDYESLTRPETIRLIAGSSRTFRIWEEAYLLYQAGRLEKRTWETMLRQFNGYLSLRPRVVSLVPEIPSSRCREEVHCDELPASSRWASH